MKYSKMRVSTIAQMKILLWLDENFAEDAVRVVFTDRNRAEITDRDGDTAQSFCDDAWKVTLT